MDSGKVRLVGPAYNKPEPRETILLAVRKTFGEDAHEYKGWEAAFQENLTTKQMVFVPGSKNKIGVTKDTGESKETQDIIQLNPPRRKGQEAPPVVAM